MGWGSAIRSVVENFEKTVWPPSAWLRQALHLVGLTRLTSLEVHNDVDSQMRLD
jgi:hypothetical protein